jgi:Domain of unknown function (DUF4383)
MRLRRRRTTDTIDDGREVVVEHGPSLAKGPALIAGSILVAFGLAALLKNNDFPSFDASFPDGEVQGTNFLGFEVNGWTAFFSITAGALLLFGAAQHHLAKMMSLIVGLALAACAVIAIIDGQDVLGLAAANFWTKLGFAIAGGAMLLNALMPRVKRRREVASGTTGATPMAERDREQRIAAVRDRDDDGVADEPRRGRRFARPARDGDAEREPVAAGTADERTVVDRDPAADAADVQTTTHRRDQ